MDDLLGGGDDPFGGDDDPEPTPTKPKLSPRPARQRQLPPQPSPRPRQPGLPPAPPKGTAKASAATAPAASKAASPVVAPQPAAPAKGKAAAVAAKPPAKAKVIDLDPLAELTALTDGSPDAFGDLLSGDDTDTIEGAGTSEALTDDLDLSAMSADDLLGADSMDDTARVRPPEMAARRGWTRWAPTISSMTLPRRRPPRLPATTLRQPTSWISAKWAPTTC